MGAERLILLAIADAASAEGEASMQSVATLARMCRVDRRTVQRHLRALEESGEIESMGVSPRYQTTIYRMPGVAGFLTRSRGRQAAAGGAAEMTQGGGTGDTQPQSTYPNTLSDRGSDEMAQSTEAPKRKPRVETPEFVTFYTTYPRHEARADAWKAWQQTVKAGIDPTCIIAGLKQQVDHLASKKGEGFCPLPASWLRAGRWDDEITPRQTPLGKHDPFDPKRETRDQYLIRAGYAG